MAKRAHFGPDLFRFLRELEANNSKAWFQANRGRYEEQVREPMLAFISDFGPHLRKITRHLTADPRPVGGSMFRIHRDTRFSRDKSPYKTHAAAQFRHRAGKDVHAPGFYLHLQPKRVFLGAGMWHPDGSSLARIRAAINRDRRGWRRAVGGSAFAGVWELRGESLRRAPKGYEPDHPLIDDLKRKDFICIAELTEREACAPAFLEQVAGRYRSAVPFLRFLARAVDLEF